MPQLIPIKNPFSATQIKTTTLRCPLMVALETKQIFYDDSRTYALWFCHDEFFLHKVAVLRKSRFTPGMQSKHEHKLLSTSQENSLHH